MRYHLMQSTTDGMYIIRDTLLNADSNWGSNMGDEDLQFFRDFLSPDDSVRTLFQFDSYEQFKENYPEEFI